MGNERMADDIAWLAINSEIAMTRPAMTVRQSCTPSVRTMSDASSYLS
jgi:hypothetical protein